MIKQLVLLVLQNPVIAGSLGIIVSGAVLYTLKSLPLKLISFFQKHLTITLTVSGEDAAFDWIDKWLDTQNFKNKARTLKFSIGQRTKADDMTYRLSPGYGSHFLWFNYRPLIINRWQSEKVGSDQGSTPRECISLTTIGRNRKNLEKVIETVQRHRSEELNENSTSVIAFGPNGYCSAPIPKTKRSLDSIFLPSELKEDIISTINYFSKNEDFYEKQCIPYSLGFLLYGPPGTGKTSLSMAIAGEFNKKVYVINPMGFWGEAQLAASMSRVEPGSVVLFEDIDVATVQIEDKDKNQQISMSALLNIIDGAAAPQDRILIMTTNHIEDLAPALIRPGRIDKQYKVDLMQPSEVKSMAKSFFPTNPQIVESFYNKATQEPLQSGAIWQHLMLEEKRINKL